MKKEKQEKEKLLNKSGTSEKVLKKTGTKLGKKLTNKPVPKKGEQSSYQKYLEKAKTQWKCFNMFAIAISAGLAVGTYAVISIKPVSWDITKDPGVDSCSDLRTTLWLVFCMHLTNAIECLINLFGCETKICTGMSLCIYFVFEITILIYSQVIYFKYMGYTENTTPKLSESCKPNNPSYYYWLMLNILVFYFVVVMTICVFFRKFCQENPNLKVEEILEEENRKKKK